MNLQPYRPPTCLTCGSSESLFFNLDSHCYDVVRCLSCWKKLIDKQLKEESEIKAEHERRMATDPTYAEQWNCQQQLDEDLRRWARNYSLTRNYIGPFLST